MNDTRLIVTVPAPFVLVHFFDTTVIVPLTSVRVPAGGLGCATLCALLHWPAVFWCREGKLVRVVGYLRRREALGAVGLAEQP